jgi:ABC-type multidrug transport system fused ATPase/permease subunit
VKFRYPTALPESPDIFTKASFSIKTGTSSAIVGPSGSGKSTIVQLINRFYDPMEGTIKYGKDDLFDLDVTALRNMIGYVGQEPVLIIGTIEDNLRYGKQDATEAEMKEALELANAMFVYDR